MTIKKDDILEGEVVDQPSNPTRPGAFRGALPPLSFIRLDQSCLTGCLLSIAFLLALIVVGIPALLIVPLVILVWRFWPGRKK